MKMIHKVYTFVFISISLLTPLRSISETPLKTITLFNGKDLTGWEITDFGTQGDVEVESSELVLGMGDGATGITWNSDLKIPKMNYEITLQAQRLSGNDFFCGLTFPVNEDHLTLIVGGWGGFVVGLSCLDGLDASENETGTMKQFANNRWYTIRVRVADDIIQAWINDAIVVDVAITNRALSLRPEVLLSRPLGIATWHTKASLKNIKLTFLDN
jgi:hypothetical protein